MLNNTMQIPVLFLGHGNPMNAIEENEFVQGDERGYVFYQRILT